MPAGRSCAACSARCSANAEPVSRWRPPVAASSAYITPQGFQTLKTELEYLWRKLRPEVVAALSAAAAEGDRSENAEYIYRKKQLGEIDRRVRYLSKRLDVLKIVEQRPSDASAIFFGAWFELEDNNGRLYRYRIVGPDETDAQLGWISLDSPIARAALKKRVDDEIEAELPAGRMRYAVLSVSYDAPI